jgi:myo-inositol 2-dehydrogenase/D-chiro-inositol 1-dehydrogenase
LNHPNARIQEFSQTSLELEQRMNRRNFIAGSAASGLLFVASKTAFGYEANSAVRHGLLGCGNRGTAVATSFAQNTSARVVALADIFPDNLSKGASYFNGVNQKLGQPVIDPKLLFSGRHAFEELAQSKDIDMIQISTPPWFHVDHLEAAVAGGKHVYCEKPVGIDVMQARKALEIAKRVDRKMSVDVGFQVRSAPPIAAAMKHVHAGALGKIASLTGNYNAPASKERALPGESQDKDRLRNWLWYRALSGDILVEQNIHIIDLCNWALGAHPLKAFASGGRNILNHPGDCWDNYQVSYTYPNDVHVAFSSTQFGDYGTFDAALHIFGADGMADLPYAGQVRIQGSHKWSYDNRAQQVAGTGSFAENGSFSDNLALADREKDRSFIESITSGKYHNQINAGVETALTCMLGRMAAYQKREVTWQELMDHGETYPLAIDLNQFG